MAMLFVAFISIFLCSGAFASPPQTPVAALAKSSLQAHSLGSAGKTARVNGSIKVGKLKRYFVLCLPEEFDPSAVSENSAAARSNQSIKRPPVVIVLHGALGNAWTAEFDSAMTEQAGKLGFIVAYPYGTGIGSKQVLFWNAGACCALASKNHVDDVSFIRELIELVKRDYNADPRRIYVAGASNGGMMAYKLANELSGLLAGMGSVEGCMFPPAKQPLSPVSVIAFHGTADDVIPYAGGTGKKLGYKVKNVQPVSKTVAFWVKHDNCRKEPESEKFSGGERETYEGGDGGSAVRLVTITDGHHLWPGGRCANLIGDSPSRSLNATHEMLDFFIKHPKP